MRFIEFQKERSANGEIAVGTIRNYYKAIKLFADMNEIHLVWKRISKGLPRPRNADYLCNYMFGSSFRNSVAVLIPSRIELICIRIHHGLEPSVLINNLFYWPIMLPRFEFFLTAFVFVFYLLLQLGINS
jgi:hypothetical protein